MAVKPLTPWIWQRPEWPGFYWDSACLAQPLANARRAQGELIGMARLLDPDSDLHAQLEVLTSDGVATSAIEGERLDPNAVRSSLARRLGLPTAGLPAPPRSVQGLVDVLIDATKKLDKPLTVKMLGDWQASLFPTGRSGLTKIRVGQLRGTAPMQIVSGPIEKQRVHYEAPPRSRLERELKRFVDWFNAPPADVELLRAGVAHAWFELIHPFEDGNGRVGRALLDRALAQDKNRSVRLYSLSARFMAGGTSTTMRCKPCREALWTRPTCCDGFLIKLSPRVRIAHTPLSGSSRKRDSGCVMGNPASTTTAEGSQRPS